MALSRGKIVFIVVSVEVAIYLILISCLAATVSKSQYLDDYYCKGYSNGTLVDGYPEGTRYVNLYKLDKYYTMNNKLFDKGVLYTMMPMDNSTRQLYISCNKYIENYLRLSQEKITNDNSKYNKMMGFLCYVIGVGFVVILLTLVISCDACTSDLED